jgi:hypothetical protein
MADIYGANYTKAFVNAVQERANAGEYGGSVKIVLDEVAAGAGLDVFYVGKLPKGARVLAISNVGGNSPTCNVAIGDVMTDETIVTLTLGAAPTFPVIGWVEYALV